MSKTWWWTLFAWFLYIASRHTWLAGIPGAEPLAAFFLIGCLSWMFSEWIFNRFTQSKDKYE